MAIRKFVCAVKNAQISFRLLVLVVGFVASTGVLLRALMTPLDDCNISLIEENGSLLRLYWMFSLPKFCFHFFPSETKSFLLFLFFTLNFHHVSIKLEMKVALTHKSKAKKGAETRWVDRSFDVSPAGMGGWESTCGSDDSRLLGCIM